MFFRIWSAALFAILVSPVVAEESVVQRFEVSQPRKAGYQLGDKFERRVSVRVEKPYELVTAALPSPARVNPWLALEAPRVARFSSGSATDYEITLTYQVVNFVPRVTDVPIPELKLTIGDGKETLPLLIRPARTQLSPLVLPTDFDMRGDLAPTARTPRLLPMLLAWFTFLVSALYLFSLYRRLPLGTGALPFTALCRQLGKLPASNWEAEHYRAAFAGLHEAFNNTAGRTLFEDELPVFFDTHTRYLPLESRIRQCFEASRHFFYAGQAAEITSRELVELARDCSDAERGLTT